MKHVVGAFTVEVRYAPSNINTMLEIYVIFEMPNKKVTCKQLFHFNRPLVPKEANFRQLEKSKKVSSKKDIRY